MSLTERPNARVIISAFPQHGHLLPLLPLARAFRDRGDEVAVLTAEDMSPVVEAEGLRLLPAGPGPEVLLDEVARQGMNATHDPTPEAVAELFAGVRVDLTADAALKQARDFQPDLVVRELCDYIGPGVAGAHDVPLATLAFGPALPPPFAEGLDAVAAARYETRGLRLQSSAWHLDTCPRSLQPAYWSQPPGWQPLRPEPHRAPGAAPDLPSPASVPASGRPRVLVTFGTFFNAPDVLSPLLRELGTLDADFIVALGLLADSARFDIDPGRVTFVPFTPMAELLNGVDAVLTHGGAGTTLAALSRGIPLVVTPQGADQSVQAEAVAGSGTGIALMPGEVTPRAVTDAVRTVLADGPVRSTANAVAAEIAALPAPAEVAAVIAGA